MMLYASILRKIEEACIFVGQISNLSNGGTSCQLVLQGLTKEERCTKPKSDTPI
jgi:hypothetical protein